MAVACGVRLACSVVMVYSVLLSVSLVRALPYSAAPTVCICLAGSLPIECCARSHMGSLYSVSEGRGSIYVIVQPDFLYALYILINGRLEASGIESVLVCFTSLPTTIGALSRITPVNRGR